MGNVLEGELAEQLASRPPQTDPFTPPARKSLGPGYDWLLELARQIYRPALGLICVLGLANHFLFAAAEARVDEMSLLILVGLAGGLAGLRTAEITMARPGR
jgi:hypothetical protein